MNFDEVIQNLSERTIHNLWLEAKNDLLHALYGAKEETKQWVFNSISDTKTKIIKEDMEQYTKRRSIESLNEETVTCQKKVLKIIKKMIDENLLKTYGKFVITDDDVKEEEIKKYESEKIEPLEIVINDIEKAINRKGALNISYYDLKSPDKHLVAAALACFKNRKDDLRKIKYLHVSANYFNDIKVLLELNSLETISLYDYCSSQLDYFPDIINGCTNLKNLEIHSDWKNIPEWISSMTFLQSIVLNCSQITELPEWFSGLTELSHLTLYLSHKSEIFPDVICRIPSLLSLKFVKNKITNISNNIKNLTLLEDIDLSEMELLSLPENLGKLVSLKKINLTGNRLTSLPDNIGNLFQLQELNLSNNPLAPLPECIGKLEDLKSLDLSYTKINSLPNNIENLTKLTNLNLQGLIIEDTYIPKSLLDRSGDFSSKGHDLHISRTKYSFPEGNLDNATFEALFYLIFQDILRFSEKAHREGLLALEEELENIGDGLLRRGLRLVVDGTDDYIIRNILSSSIERETNQNQKRLKTFILEGILAIQAGETAPSIMIYLNSLMDIKENLFDQACAAYLSGDERLYKNIMETISKIKFPEEREELKFIRRAMEFSETIRRYGFKAIEKMLDIKTLASRDILEYGLRLYLDCEKEEYINKVLDNFISHETDPYRKNLQLAKRKALNCILAGENPRLLVVSIMSYFDESIIQLCSESLLCVQ
jgi:Leucine-rich repeat (LRR) protein